MKRIIIASVFNIFFLHIKNTIAQSKTDTEEWINSKMQLIKDRSVSDLGTIASFTTTLKTFMLKDGMLSYSYLQYNNQTGHITGADLIRGSNIPIKYLKTVSTGNSNKEYYSIYLEFENHVNVFSNINYKRSEIHFKIPKIEDNLGERFVKAFKHYKSLYPTPSKPKETF